ncbi:MAG TPA: zinc finger Ran-binding domain-containing protein [Candidatus Limnocylindrales bacterium]
MTLESAQTALIYLLLVYGGGLIAWGVWHLVARIRRQAGSTTRHLMERPEPPPWVQDHWACDRCRTVNPRWADRCQRCRTERASAQIPVPPPAGEPDIIPAAIQAAGALVLLEHNAAAHDDGLAGHWRLRVNGVVSGSVARRGGALALLRALEGAETVYYDPKGNGVRPCPVRALISAFEAPTLPLVGPFPEHATGIPSGH